MRPNAVICRYAEIALKGNNRNKFEALLMDAILSAMGQDRELKFQRERGRIWLIRKDREPFSDAQLERAREALPRVFGLESTSPGILLEPDAEALIAAAIALFGDAAAHWRRAHPKARTLSFRTRARRQDKSFPVRSKELEIAIAERLEEYHDDLTVDLLAADLTIRVEVRKTQAFVSLEDWRGPGGLAIGSSSPVLALLSGGIDSPVASWLLMKRGCPVDFITFHSAPYTPPETILKVAAIARILRRHQHRGRLFACNLLAAQKLVRDHCDERFRTILYRRLMMRVAGGLAHDLGAKALATGDNVGQVASQTIRNLDLVNRATRMLVLRPLIGANKHEIVELARRIGTLETSQQQCIDSCVVFAPKSPSTGSPVGAIEHQERLLDRDELARLCWEGLAEVDLESGELTPYVLHAHRAGATPAPPATPEPTRQEPPDAH